MKPSIITTPKAAASKRRKAHPAPVMRAASAHVEASPPSLQAEVPGALGAELDAAEREAAHEEARVPAENATRLKPYELD